MDTFDQDTPPIKSRFWDIFIRLRIDYEGVQRINEQAGVAPRTVEKMALGDPVSQESAEKVLAVLSQQIGYTLTLDIIDVVLRSQEEQQRFSQRLFFPDLWRIHRFRLDLIAPLAQVSEEVISAMLRNQPVTKTQAESVLAALSRALKQEYTLENVFVFLEGEGGEDAASK